MAQPKPGRPVIRTDAGLKRMYWIWNAMIRRCHDPRTKQYADYGGRGIVVCDEWRADFWAFYDDMAPRPPGQSMIDRVDNDAGYGPHNCRWVNAAESNANRRWCKLMCADGDIMPLKTYMRHKGYTANDYRMVVKRIRAGMSATDAITTPRRARP